MEKGREILAKFASSVSAQLGQTYNSKCILHSKNTGFAKDQQVSKIYTSNCTALNVLNVDLISRKFG